MNVATLRPRLCVLIALALAFVYHGGLLLGGTFKRTYDAYVHIFFADHYSRTWFDNWDYRWYTGFTLTSYPPGSQQSIALLSNFVGLLNGFVIVQMFAILLVVVGIYRFSCIWVSEEAAGYASILAVFSSSISETVHVFGQLPTMFSLGFLLNALPFVRRWLDDGDPTVLLMAWSVNAATTAAHHVTTLFGAVFFCGPVIAAAIVDKLRQPLPDEPPDHPARITRQNVRGLIVRRVRRIIPVTFRSGVYAVGLVVVLVGVVLPYWLWSKSDPINQVSIPHASRDSFIKNTAAGLVFWLVPYGVSLAALPYAFAKGMVTRAWALTLSLALLVFLGTGGTTPFPKMLLGGAFDVLTLDRFTFWATISVLPLLGEFVVSMLHGRLARTLREQFGTFVWRGTQIGLVVAYLGFSVFTVNLTQFRKFQPAAIDAQPIVTFLEKDQHWRWRYLFLGFGDQMAWVSAQTTATTVDGNYHSARRLPELTTTPIERLEGAKYSGIPGIGSLQQFLAVPDKYNLKYVLSNDQFYDPLLFFSGWHRVQRLENGIVVWERADIPPLPEVLPRKNIPVYQRAMWGIVPMSAIATALLVLSSGAWGPWARRGARFLGVPALMRRLPPLPGSTRARQWWHRFDSWLVRWSALPPAPVAERVPWQWWSRLGQRVRLPAKHFLYRFRRPIQIVTALVALGCVAGVVAWQLDAARDARTPTRIVQDYYDDLDFRRFNTAWARLDPRSRPNYDQYLLDLSVTGGLVASYGKLDTVTTEVVDEEPGRVVVEARIYWVTALARYPVVERHVLYDLHGTWVIEPQPVDIRVPSQQFVRRGVVSWYDQGRGRPTTETTDFAAIQDRPTLQVFGARLVRFDDRYSVVGEVLNTDDDPADITVTAYLRDKDGNELTWYNAQGVVMHKLLPKEVTPFRIDFEGVAGAVLTDTLSLTMFDPLAFSPPVLKQPVASFDVYAKGVVTQRDLQRDVTAQDMRVVEGDDGELRLQGTLFNTGTSEATIPHLLLSYYDAAGNIAWVGHDYVPESIAPQRQVAFDVALAHPADISTEFARDRIPGDAQQDAVAFDPAWRDRFPMPPNSGWASVRVSINYLVGGGP